MSCSRVPARPGRSTKVSRVQSRQVDKAKSLQIYGVKFFLADKGLILATNLTLLLILILFLSAFRVRTEIIILVTGLWLAAMISALAIEYARKVKFYRQVIQNANQLDQAYLVLETLEMPRFYDGKILYQVLYQAHKSMAENVKNYRIQAQDFQEYVEMWIHEVKTPLATLAVIAKDPRINAQIKRLDDCVEQVLYFTRVENAERDYLIKLVELAEVVGVVANRNREILQAKRIELKVHDLDTSVHTDAKWLEFILNQIINNSIKYQAHQITITAERTEKTTLLKIRDDGIGITAKDLPRVFEKSFTGNNGHNFQKTTGMGLYIAKSLCEKLGHQISVSSKLGQYTELTISFADNKYYKVLEKSKPKSNFASAGAKSHKAPDVSKSKTELADIDANLTKK